MGRHPAQVPQFGLDQSRALTAALRDRFSAVEAIFQKMDGLVEQFGDGGFIEGYFAARSVVEAGRPQKKAAAEAGPRLEQGVAPWGSFLRPGFPEPRGRGRPLSGSSGLGTGR